jgi:hypothetical protein
MQLTFPSRGYTYGSGFVSPDGKQFLVSIPKNASSYLGNVFGHHGWQIANINECNTLEKIVVVLRDPVSRWVSGVSQYLQTYIFYPHGPNTPHLAHETPDPTVDYGFSVEQFMKQYNQLVERLMFDNLNLFDDHVWSQCEFFKNLAIDIPRQYLYIDKNFNKTLYKEFGIEPMHDVDNNSHENQTVLSQLQDFFYKRLQERPVLKQRIINAYWQDYELIKEVINDPR